VTLPTRHRVRPSLSTQVLIRLFLGLGAGVFFGDTLAFLQVVGQAFIELLQMTVLPYIILLLITGIGLSFSNTHSIRGELRAKYPVKPHPI
jgi:Na+/H+-dicarboxylate symporter